MNKKREGLKILFLALMLFTLIAGQVRAAEPKVQFSIDINRLDKILSFFLSEIPADNWMEELDRYDQDGDGDNSVEFNIFDVDYAINEFLNPPIATECGTRSDCGEADDNYNWRCETTDDSEIKYCIQCHEDSECGDGAHCKENMCRKSCGTLSGGNAYADCYGRNKACDVERGECYEVDDARTSCQMDGDCLGGNYCLLGVCESLCYRSLDCPGTEWMCSKNNKCLLRPNDPSLAPIDYSDYQVMFGGKVVILRPDMPFIDIPVVIMNKVTRTEVIDDPRIKIPYRLKVRYQLRKSPGCEADANMTDEDFKELEKRCEPESFLIMSNPVGVLDGESGQKIRFTYDDYLLRNLPSGDYTVDVELIAGTGNISAATIEYRNPSISGHYLGTITLNEPKYSGVTTIGMNINITDSIVQWDKLLKGEEIVKNESGNDYIPEINLNTALPIRETFQGQFVWGEVLTSESSIFNNTTAKKDDEKEIFSRKKSVPFVGIYTADGNKIRLIFELNMAKNFTTLDTKVGSHLTYKNLFKRPIRRMVIINGKLDSLNRTLNALYRETIYGIGEENRSYTVGGDITMGQLSSFGNNIYPENGFLKIGHGIYNEHCLSGASDVNYDYESEDQSFEAQCGSLENVAESELDFKDYLPGYEAKVQQFIQHDLPFNLFGGEYKKCTAENPECDENLVCDTRIKRCVKPLECDENRRCGEGLICNEEKNICIKSDGCGQDSDCDTESGFFCLENTKQCAKADLCDSENPCPAGFACDSISKKCEKMESCDPEKEAPRGLICDESTQTYVFENSCQFDTECGGSLKCDKEIEKCVEKEVCYENTDCMNGLICNKALSRCVDKFECSKDDDCSEDGTYKCDRSLNLCYKTDFCDSHDDCAKGFMCETRDEVNKCVFRSGCSTNDDCARGYLCNSEIDQCVKYSECYNNDDCKGISIECTEQKYKGTNIGYEYVKHTDTLEKASCNILTKECVSPKDAESSNQCDLFVYDVEVNGYKRKMSCEITPNGDSCEENFGSQYFCDELDNLCKMKQDCASDMDCVEGFVCSDEIKQCVPKSICKTDDDCTIPGTYCHGELDECVMGDECIADSQCQSGSFCDLELDKCVKLESCDENGQCGKGFACDSERNICMKTSRCNSDFDCSGGFECNSDIKTCQKVSECKNSGECNGGFLCHPQKKECVKKGSCEDDYDCDENSYCNGTTNECVVIDKCISDTECKESEGFACNTAQGLCVESGKCSNESPCEDGFVCDENLSECVKIKSDSGLNFREELEIYEKKRFGSIVSLETKLMSAIRSLKGKISQIDIEETLEDQAELCEDGNCNDGADTKIDMRKMIGIAHAYGVVIRNYALAPASDISLHNEISRSKRYALTQRFIHYMNEILIAYNYAAGDMVSKSFRLFLKGVSEEKVDGKTFSEYDYTIAAMKYHEKAREFLYNPHIQETLRNIQNHPFYANPEGKTTDFGTPAYEYSTELGTMGVEEGVLKRPFDHMMNSVSMLSKYISL